MTATNSLYIRGAATAKATTASLAPGALVLTVATDQLSVFTFATRKADAVWREVASTRTVEPGPRGRQRRYILQFTDGSRALDLAPSQTWIVPTT